MGQEKTFSSALSNLAKMKTDAEKAALQMKTFFGGQLDAGKLK